MALIMVDQQCCESKQVSPWESSYCIKLFSPAQPTLVTAVDHSQRVIFILVFVSLHISSLTSPISRDVSYDTECFLLVGEEQQKVKLIIHSEPLLVVANFEIDCWGSLNPF